MEFEISADGELVAYHGTGGNVEIPEGVKFIARKGVFDKDCKITQLCLPSTLIGHKYDEHCSCPHVITKSASGDTVSVQRCKKSRAKNLAKDSLLFDVLSLDLPHLSSYVVSKDNKLYKTVDGVLIFRERVIVAVPARTPLPVKMEQTYAQYMQQTKKLRPYDQPPVTIRLKGQSLELGQISKILSLQLFASKRANLLLFYGPEITSLSLDEQDIEALFSVHNAVLVTPKCQPKGSLQQMYLALCGFCHKPEMYLGKIKESYLGLLVRHERKLYELAISKQLVMVRRFFNEMWRKPFNYHQEKMYLSHTGQIIEAVLRGTIQDINLVVKKFTVTNEYYTKGDKRIDACSAAVYLACRYAGLGMLNRILHSKLLDYWYGSYGRYSKALVDFDPDSCEFIYRRNIYNKRYKTHCSSTLDRELLIYLSSFEPIPKLSPYLFTDNKGEIRSYDPISTEERFRCICYCLKDSLFTDEAQTWKCFFSYMLDMSEQRRKELAKGAKFYSFVGTTGSLFFLKLLDALLFRGLKEKPHNVVAFAKLLQQQNQLLPIHKSAVLAPLVDQKDIVFELMPLCKLDGECLMGFIKMLIEHDRADTMSALLKTGIVEQHMTLSELRTLFEDSNSPELHAVLLDYLHIKTSSGHSLRADLTL